jgi:D-alanyl-D-alanine-carboxypeptidase/D-alanyl-D-alanine-endopeptidase
MSNRKPFLLAALLLAFTSASYAQRPLPSLQQADIYGQELFTASGSTGMVLVIVRNHEVYIHGFGETGPNSHVAPTATSFLRLCSLSKIFSTDLLAQLASQHIVRLEDPLQLYAPTGITVPSRSARAGEEARLITLEDLATHTAGLPREVGWAPNGTPHFTFPDYNFRWQWLPSQHLRKTPGTAALYSNIGFDLLGDALAHATKQPYSTLFATHISKPLGMKETTFTPTPAQCSRLLQGAHNEGSCTDTQSSAASAGVYSTGNDMAIFLKYLLGTWAPGTPAQNAAAQAVYVTPTTLTSESGLDHAGAVTGIGLGWMHTPGRPTDLDAPPPPAADTDLIEKTGGGAGFLTYIAINHSANTALFLAVTDGRHETHLNVFRAANNLLLTLDGLPTLPLPIPRPAAKSRRRSKQSPHTGTAKPRAKAAVRKPVKRAKR